MRNPRPDRPGGRTGSSARRRSRPVDCLTYHPLLSGSRAPDELAVQTTLVQGRPAYYGVGGDGPPILFLHGWGLGFRAYRRAIRRLTAKGHRVYAPCLPGMGGTADLPWRATETSDYGNWVAAFLDRMELTDPIFVIGHSFGGGVAINLAHAHPGRVRYLVLLNSVGGASWEEGALAERPMWDWAWQWWRELLPTPQGIGTLAAMSEDMVRNVVTNPWGLLRSGQAALTADLRAELTDLAARQLPILALSSDGDGIVPDASFQALCSAMGAEGRIVRGSHSWLLTNPDVFGEVLGNVLDVQEADRDLTIDADTALEIGRLLARTEVPADLVDQPPRRSVTTVADERDGTGAGRRPGPVPPAARTGRGPGRGPGGRGLDRHPPHRRGRGPARPAGGHRGGAGQRGPAGDRGLGRHLVVDRSGAPRADLRSGPRLRSGPLGGPGRQAGRNGPGPRRRRRASPRLAGPR